MLLGVIPESAESPPKLATIPEPIPLYCKLTEQVFFEFVGMTPSSTELVTHGNRKREVDIRDAYNRWRRLRRHGHVTCK